MAVAPAPNFRRSVKSIMVVPETDVQLAIEHLRMTLQTIGRDHDLAIGRLYRRIVMANIRIRTVPV